MKTLKQKMLILALVATSVLASSIAMAVAVNNVGNTKHNFAIGGTPLFSAAAGTGATQVCIFCHTPHNAGNTRLLWNKAGNGNINFRLYTSSGSLTNVTSTSSLPANSPSLLCLGCHDGKTAMNILHNSSSGVDAASVPGVSGYPAGAKLIPTSNAGVAPYPMPGPVYDLMLGTTTPDMRIGGDSGSDLTNDHPIGFSYSAAYAEKLASGGGLKPMDPSVRFFGPTNRVECSTCHNPHVDTSTDSAFAPFLVKSNTNSALCLTCHDK